MPSITITLPVNGTVLQTNFVAITASATDLDGTITNVEFFLNGLKVADDQTAPYRLEWTFTDFGSHRFTARMTTSGGTIVVADPVTVTVARELLSTQFIAAGATWKYLDNGTSQGTSANPTWALPAFNDSAWLTGAARFGYGGDGEVTALRETRADSTRIITF